MPLGGQGAVSRMSPRTLFTWERDSTRLRAREGFFRLSRLLRSCRVFAMCRSPLGVTPRAMIADKNFGKDFKALKSRRFRSKCARKPR